MGIIGALKIVFQICGSFVFTMQFNHLIVLGAICVLFIALILFPSVLRFFVSCLPILICTAVLVKILLGFGSQNNTQNENEEKKTSGGSSSNLCEFEKRDGFTVETRLKKKKGIRERALEKSGIIIGGKEKKVAFSPRPRDSLMRRRFKIEEFPEADESSQKDDDTLSSPDTPPINVLPVIDEIDPLLDTEVPEAPDEFDAGLESPDRSVDGSVDSEVENQEGKENEVDGAKALVTWTEDDEKNLMDLGTSELERNQRLENLIAKRRARKDVTKANENNLIDFESNDPQPQVPSITIAKSNPFDGPYEAENLPPIPSSAPSNFAPKKNPFDLPYDPQEEKPNLTQDSFQQEFMSVFCRHESFNFGPSYTMGSKQDRYNTKFIPFFGNEDMSSEGLEYPGSLGLPNERRSSLSGAFPEADSLPPIDPKNRKKQMGRALSLGVYPSNHAPKERKIPEINPIKINQEVESEANLDSAETKDVGLHDTSEASFLKPEQVKEPNVAPLSEISEQVDDVKTEDPSLPMEESDNNSSVDEEVHVKEPVYDSSPSAVEKRTIDEYLVYPDNGPSLTSSSSIASDMHVEVSESGSPRHPDADEESSFQQEIVKFATESNDSVPKEKEEPVKSVNDAPQGGVAMHESVHNNPVPPPVVDPELAVDPSSAKPETHVEVRQQDSVAASSSSSDLNKLESMTEEVKGQPSSHNHHYEESQEASVEKSTEEVKKIDNVNEQLSNDNITANHTQPMESGTVDTETSTTHETTNSRPFEAGHMADGDSKQQREEVGESMKEEDGGKLEKENKIHTDNAEDPKQDQN